jgi:hypothetical protein
MNFHPRIKISMYVAIFWLEDVEAFPFVREMFSILFIVPESGAGGWRLNELRHGKSLSNNPSQ